MQRNVCSKHYQLFVKRMSWSSLSQYRALVCNSSTFADPIQATLSAFLPIQFRPNPAPSFRSPLKASVDKLTGKLTISKFQIRLSCTIYISSPIIRFPPHKATARRPYTPLFKKFSSRKIRSRLLANFHFVLMREATRRNLLKKDCNALCRLRRELKCIKLAFRF